VNRVTDLVARTLGDRTAGVLKTKAAETRPLLEFCCVLTQRFREILQPENSALGPALAELFHFSELVRRCPTILGMPERQALVDVLKRYIVLSQRAEIPPSPKLHLTMHLVERTGASEISIAGFQMETCHFATRFPHIRFFMPLVSSLLSPLCGFPCPGRCRTASQGSPAFASTFIDESANGVAKDIAMGLHRRTFTKRFFQFWAQAGRGKRKLDD
jgi:hypothetical protein